MGEFIRYNIAIRIVGDLAEYVMEMSRKLAKQSEPYFILDDKNFYPHITVYSPEFPMQNASKVRESVGSLLKGRNPFEVKFSDFDIHLGYIGICVDLNENLKPLHDDVVRSINPLRVGHLREKYTKPENLQHFSAVQKECIKKYGYADAMDLYVPHITIIRLKDKERALELGNHLVWEPKSFVVEKMGIFEMGSNGTCVKLVEKFEL